MNPSQIISDDPTEQFMEIMNQTILEAANAEAEVVRLKAEVAQLKTSGEIVRLKTKIAHHEKRWDNWGPCLDPENGEARGNGYICTVCMHEMQSIMSDTTRQRYSVNMLSDD